MPAPQEAFPGQTDNEPAGLAEFTRHRSLLFTVAYEMLGSTTDAEDVVQEVWLRWAEVANQPESPEIAHPRAYLVRITTRLALNRLRSLSRIREDYVGPWLPEPLLTRPDIADDVVLSESVSMAMMVVMDSLSPEERAVFLLNEVFGYSHTEIAVALERTPASVRQLAHRARQHVQARRPKFQTTDEERDRITQAFHQATFKGDLQGLLDLMAPDVVLLSDGGGIVRSALRPVLGPDHVSRLMLGLAGKYGGEVTRVELQHINGLPTWAYFVGEVLTVTLQLQIEEDGIAGVYAVTNPEKLAKVTAIRDLAR